MFSLLQLLFPFSFSWCWGLNQGVLYMLHRTRPPIPVLISSSVSDDFQAFYMIEQKWEDTCTCVCRMCACAWERERGERRESICMCTNGTKGKILSISLLVFIHLFWRQGVLLAKKLASDLGWVACELQGSSHLCLPSAEIVTVTVAIIITFVVWSPLASLHPLSWFAFIPVPLFCFFVSCDNPWSYPSTVGFFRLLFIYCCSFCYDLQGYYSFFKTCNEWYFSCFIGLGMLG